MNSNLPKYYPRAQVTGVLRWTCVYCAHVNVHSLRPTAFKTKCRGCEKHTWWGLVAHIPAGTTTKIARDSTIPVWADEEYSFDPLPKAMFDPDKRIQQRGRLHAVVIHGNIYESMEPVPESPEEAEEKE